jgi:hypothetical protein
MGLSLTTTRRVQPQAKASPQPGGGPPASTAHVNGEAPQGS